MMENTALNLIENRRSDERRKMISHMQRDIEARAKVNRWSKATTRFITELSKQCNPFGGVWTGGISGVVLRGKEIDFDPERMNDVKTLVSQLTNFLDRQGILFAVTIEGDLVLYAGEFIGTYLWER